jgi:hypothetical protein
MIKREVKGCTVDIYRHTGRVFQEWTLKNTNITQTDVMSPDILSLQTFCPHGRFVPQICLQMFCLQTFCLLIVSPDVLPCLTFCPAGRFFPQDVLSRLTFCPSGHLVLDRMSLDVLFGHWWYGTSPKLRCRSKYCCDVWMVGRLQLKSAKPWY